MTLAEQTEIGARRLRPQLGRGPAPVRPRAGGTPRGERRHLPRARRARHRRLPARPAAGRADQRRPDPAPLEAFAADVRLQLPELDPQLLAPAELAELEPARRPGPTRMPHRDGVGRPAGRRDAAFADRARAAGARFAGWPDSFELDANVTLVAAGPWTPGVVDPTGRWRPIEPSGASWPRSSSSGHRSTCSRRPGIPELADALGAGEAGRLSSSASSRATAATGSARASQASEPDEATHRAGARRAREALPARHRRASCGARACARPVSADGRPLIGPARR